MVALFEFPQRLRNWTSQEMHRRELLSRLPGPPGHPVLGNLLDLRVDTFLSTTTRWASQYGPVYRCRLLHRPLIVISGAEHVQELLRRRPGDVRRVSDFEHILGKFDIGGVLAAEGDQWRRQRRLVMAAFGASKASDMHAAILRVTERMLAVWEKDAGHSRDVLPDMMRFTADVMSLIAFGYDLRSVEGAVNLQEHVTAVLQGIARRVFAPVPYWRFIPSGRERAVSHAIRTLQGTMEKILAADEEAVAGTLLGRLRQAQLEERSQRRISEQELFSNVMLLMLAGEETSANQIAWTLYFMAANPGVQERMREEVDAVLGDSDRVQNHKQAGALRYTNAVFQESMRLHPAVPMLPHECIRDIDLGEYRIPAGVAISVLLNKVGIEHENFPEPERFDPERWLDVRAVDTPYRPFGSGPRMCPGRGLAMLEAQTLIGTFLRRFVVEPAPGTTPPREVMDFTAGPDRVDLRIRPRHPS